MYAGSDAQFKTASMSGPTATNLGTIFGQSLLYNNNQLAQSGVGKGLYVPNPYIVSPGTSMFGPYLSVAQMPQLLCYSGNWNLTTGTDQGGSAIIAIDGSVTDTFDLNPTTGAYQRDVAFTRR